MYQRLAYVKCVKFLVECNCLLTVVSITILYVYAKIALWTDELAEVRVRVRGPLAGDDPRVVALVRETFLESPSPHPYNLSSLPIPDKFKFAAIFVYKSSWGFTHEHIEKLFGRQRGGFFVEAGALDGERDSNTLWLEQQRGWTGLLVEPEPENYLKLHNKHRKAWTSNTCLSPEPFPKESVFVSLGGRYVPDSVSETRSYNYRAASHLFGVELNTNFFDWFYVESEEYFSMTRCFPLVSYLLALDQLTIDLLSLDIQGAEKDVLKNLPWNKITVRVIVVKIVHHETFDKEFVNYMKEKRYILLTYIPADYIFVREHDPVLTLPGVYPMKQST